MAGNRQARNVGYLFDPCTIKKYVHLKIYIKAPVHNSQRGFATLIGKNLKFLLYEAKLMNVSKIEMIVKIILA